MSSTDTARVADIPALPSPRDLGPDPEPLGARSDLVLGKLSSARGDRPKAALAGAADERPQRARG